MKPDLLDELRAADPARRRPADADALDWDALAARILATPRRAPAIRRAARRPRAVLPAVAVAVGAVLAALALVPAAAPPSVLERVHAAATREVIYGYSVTTRELAGPRLRPVPGTGNTAEGWISPASGEIHEIAANGDEWATDGRRRTVYTAFADTLDSHRLPGGATEGSASGHVLDVLTAAIRGGELRDAGPGRFEGRAVRRLVAVNRSGTWRQTFLVDARTHLPVRFLSETGDHLRDGRPRPADARVVEQRFDRFEALPESTPRTVLDMRPHPGARAPEVRPAVP